MFSFYMADPAVNLPTFARAILAAGEDSAKLEILERVHPDYATHQDSWQVLLDAFQGSGGFLDGSYLWPYPRESAADFQRRQSMARYHNYLETLVDLYVRFLFTQGVKRTSKDAGYNDWTENIDGAGTTLTEHLKRFASVALVHGHAGTLVDKTDEEPDGPSRSAERARVVATLFPAISITDWRFARNTLAAVKLLEAAPAPDLTEDMPDGDDATQYLLWDLEGWARFDRKGNLLSADLPDLGIVPLVVLRPKPSYLNAMLGRPLVSNANVVRALYNRAAEEDQVIRDQAFSLLTVAVPADGDVQAAKEALGNTVGTSKAIVSQGVIDYKTPDQSVPGTIRENIAYLVQEMYRAAHVRFNRDSLQAESAEAIRLQNSELNEALQGMGKALAEAERQIARAYFAWSYPTPEQAQAAYDKAQVEVTYPDEFFLDALIADLQAWAEAIRMDLGPTMTRRIKKRAVRRLDPEIPQEELAKVDQEIDTAPVEPQMVTANPLDLGNQTEMVPPDGMEMS